MAKPKEKNTKAGKPMHFSVGALIERDGKYLLIERAVPPLGFAGVAGHIDEGEDERQAVIREVKEEVGFDVNDPKLLFEEELDGNWCSKGATSHYWYLFHCPVSGEMERSERETKSVGWYSKEEIKKMILEPAWEYWFRKLGILS
jgi:8-oxo-dGTP pyrophosphatase MutT (NUDIX family)